MFEPNQRVKVNLSGLTIRGVAFSQNVQEAPGTIMQRETKALLLRFGAAFESTVVAAYAWERGD